MNLKEHKHSVHNSRLSNCHRSFQMLNPHFRADLTMDYMPALSQNHTLEQHRPKMCPCITQNLSKMIFSLRQCPRKGRASSTMPEFCIFSVLFFLRAFKHHAQLYLWSTCPRVQTQGLERHLPSWPWSLSAAVSQTRSLFPLLLGVSRQNYLSFLLICDQQGFFSFRMLFFLSLSFFLSGILENSFQSLKGSTLSLEFFFKLALELKADQCPLCSSWYPPSF